MEDITFANNVFMADVIMILSILVGVAFRRYLPDDLDHLVRALIIGAVLGLLGNLGLVYPFFISVDHGQVTIPEVTPFGFYFVMPLFKLFTFTLPFDAPYTIGPPFVTILFVSISLVGVLIGHRIVSEKGEEKLWPSNQGET